MKSRYDDVNILLIFLQSTMAETPDVESSLREPTADEVRALSQQMGFVIREEEISVYQGIKVSIMYFPFPHDTLCLPPPPPPPPFSKKKKHNMKCCCEMLLGGLHISKSISQQ